MGHYIGEYSYWRLLKGILGVQTMTHVEGISSYLWSTTSPMLLVWGTSVDHVATCF